MALRNYQYNTILREYDNRRLQSKYELDRRKEEVYKAIPVLSEIDAKMVEDSIKSAKLSLTGDTEALRHLEERNQLRSKEKQQLLESHGYPKDYLQPKYICNACQDTGYVQNSKCHCFKQAIVDLLYSQSNVRDAIKVENFSTFTYKYYSDHYIEETTNLTPYENMKRVVKKAKRFIEEFDEKYENLLIYGNTGVGKTFLSNCIAKELLDKAHTVIYLTSFQLFEILEKYKFNHEDDYENIRNQFDYILDCDLLIIDDIGTELSNSFINSQLYQCINERHLKQKSTIISTNLSFEQLKSNYSERIFSRITSNYILLKIVGEDIRPQVVHS